MRRIGAALAGVVALTAAVAAAPPPAPAQSPPAVAFVGDSIGRNAQPLIEPRVAATNPIGYYHAIGAGYIAYHLPLLVPVVSAPDGPDIVVAELGTGDAFWSLSPEQFEADVRAFLEAVLPHVECVVWIDQKVSPNRAYPMINERAAAFNEVVHRVVGEYEGATYLHYAAWTELAGSPSPYFLADHLHLTTPGEKELARLVASAVRGCDPTSYSGPFWDVPDAFWAAEAINWAAEEGIVQGFDNGTYRAVVGQFRPKVTRGDAAQMLWRLAGSPTGFVPHAWRDGRGAWVASALDWGQASGVFGGYPDGTFRPRQPVDRGQLVVWLWRLAGRPGPFPRHPWPDDIRRIRPALNWAAAHGIVTGVGTGTDFVRDGTVDRAEIAVWLQATDAFLDPPPPPPPTTEPPGTTVPPDTTLPVTTLPPLTTAPPGTTVPSGTSVP